jgi:hypothetical protein
LDLNGVRTRRQVREARFRRRELPELDWRTIKQRFM